MALGLRWLSVASIILTVNFSSIAFADALFSDENVAAIEKSIQANAARLRSPECKNGCSIKVAQDDMRFTPVRIKAGTEEAYTVEMGGMCGSAGCPTGLFIGSSGKWTKAFESLGAYNVLTTATSGYFDIKVSGKFSETIFAWNGTRYAERGSPQTANRAEQRKFSSGELMVSSGTDAATDAVIWTIVPSGALGSPCELKYYSTLQAFAIVSNEKLLSLNNAQIQALILSAADKARTICPQTRTCTPYSSLQNPLAPRPSGEQTRCTVNSVPTIELQIAPTAHAYRTDESQRPAAVPVYVTATVTGSGSATQIRADDRGLRQFRTAQAEAAEAQRKAAEEAQARLATKGRFKEFEQTTKITSWPQVDELWVNPFVYEGKIVGVSANFSTMVTGDRGLFNIGGDKFMLVSDIPKGFYTSQIGALVAGNVVGKEDVRIAPFGIVSVPHLRFVGSYRCQQQGCPDMRP